MLEKVKDGLLGSIVMGGKNYWSISSVLKADYERYKTTGEGYGLATYRDIIIDLENDGIDESLFSNIQNQINSINDMSKDGE